MSDELTLDQVAYCHERADARRKVWTDHDRREEMAKAIQHPNLKEVGGGMETECYSCEVCGESYTLYYEDMA